MLTGRVGMDTGAGNRKLGRDLEDLVSSESLCEDGLRRID